MTEECPLLSLPELPMRNVLEYLNYGDIQKLRKSCNLLRKFVDKSKIDFHVQSIKMNFKLGPNYCTPSIELNFNYSGKQMTLQYWKHGNSSCYISAKESGLKLNSESIMNQDYFDAFLEDFFILLGYVQTQKSPLESFEMRGYTNCDPFLANLKNSCDDGKKLKAKKLSIDIEDDIDAFNILQCFDAKFVKNLKIDHQETTSATLSLEELSQMELWRQMEQLEIKYFEVQSVADIWHLQEARVPLERITTEEILSLKNKFLSSNPPRNCFELVVYDTVDAEGAGLENEITRYFKTATSEKILSMGLVHNTLTLKTIELSNVPNGVQVF